jgi:transposase, IS5 family
VVRCVGVRAGGRRLRGQAGFFDIEERLNQLSAKGDELERLSQVVDFERFRADLEAAGPRADGSKGGRPAFDHVLMFKVLVLQANHNLSDERTAYLVKDRRSFLRFLGLGLADTAPDANTIWTFREVLTRARIKDQTAIAVLFQRFDDALSAAGFPAMGGQIIAASIAASIAAAPKQRDSDGEKREIKAGRIKAGRIKAGRIPAEWAKQPAKLRHKDRDARWTVKSTKAKPRVDGAPRVDLAIPAFGDKNHLGIDRRHRLIGSWAVTDAARCDGALLPRLIDKHNTASDLWADTAYRSKANQKYLADNGLRSQIHRKKPNSLPRRGGKPMPRRAARANPRKSKIRAAVEHVLARQKGPMELFIRTIGLARATTKIGLANLVYNLKRLIRLAAPAATA